MTILILLLQAVLSEVITGTNTSYQAREPIENEERLAMKRCDMPSQSLSELTIQGFENQALLRFCSNSERIHRSTSEDAYTQAWFEKSRSIFTQSLRKTGTNVELWKSVNIPVECSQQQQGFISTEEWIPKTTKLEEVHCQKWKVQCRRFVTSPRILGRACDSDSRSWQCIDKHKTVAWGLRLGGMSFTQR